MGVWTPLMVGEHTIQDTGLAEDPERAEARENGTVGSQFLASLNHDIRTPLSGIMGMTDLLLETELNGEQQEYVRTTRFCADQLLEMLNAALEYAALSSGEFRLDATEFHLPEVIRELVREYLPKAESKGLTLACSLGESVPAYVIGDAIRLRQILWSLLHNALKFTPRGEVEVTASAESNSGDTCTLVASVRDTGIGIPQDKLLLIFDSFRQLESGLSRTYPGLGLGLALSRKLALLMGGDITVESIPEMGSTFQLRVPLHLPRGREEEPSRDAKGTGTDDGRHRILLVEDNEVARQVVTHILGRANYFVHCASGGREGIEAASRYRYDLILMDLQMPDVNGLDATAAIRQLPGYKTVPVLALSANYSDEFRNRCREAGMQHFLSKPIQSEDLLRALRRHLS